MWSGGLSAGELRSRAARLHDASPPLWATLLPPAAALGLLPLGGPTWAGVAALALVAAGAVLWFRRFDLLLHLLVLSYFVESVGVGPIRVGRVLAVLALLLLVGRILLTTWRPRLALSPGVLLPVGLLVIWVWTSGLWATDTRAWAYALGQIALALAYFVTFALVLERREQVYELLQTVVGGAVFAATVGFVQVAAGAARAEGLQGDPNIYALYQVAALPAAAWLATGGPAPRRWAGWAAIPVLLASVAATQSRGGLVAASAVLLLMAVRGDLGAPLRGHRAATLTVVGGLVAGAAFTAMTVSTRFQPERVLSDRASGRLDIWFVAFREWQAHPLLGIGGGGFKPRSVDLLVTEPGVQLLQSHLLLSSGIEVHNIYLEMLVEYGLVGFALFLAVLTATTVHLARAARSGDPGLRTLPMILVAFLAASFFLSIVNNKLLWILVGLAAVAGARDPLPTVPARPLPRRRTGTVPRRRVAALVAVALAATVAAVTTALGPDRYEAAQHVVVHTPASPPERELVLGTLETLLTSRPVAVDAVTRARTGLTPEALLNQLSVTRPGGALVLRVAVTDRDPRRAGQQLQGLSQAFLARLSSLDAPAGGTGPRYDLRLWGDGAVSTTELSRPVLRNAVLGAVLGAAWSALVLACLAPYRPARKRLYPPSRH